MKKPFLFLDGSTPVLVICGQAFKISKKELESLSHDCQQAEMFLMKSKVTKYEEMKNVGIAT